MRCYLLFVFIVCNLWGSSAFHSTPKLSPTTRFATSLFKNTKYSSSLPPIRNISYGEESRKYRRTVYNHDDWRKHRSPDRFIHCIRSMRVSGIYKNVSREVMTATLISLCICIYNALVGSYVTFSGVRRAGILSNLMLPVLSLPLVPFTLSSPSLGLLLVFRTNTSYSRWDAARKNWGKNINHTRNLVRMATAFYDRSAVSAEECEKDLETLSLCTWAFVRSMKRELSPADEDEIGFQQELRKKLPQGQADAIIQAKHRANRALQDLSLAIENLPMHFLRKNELHASLSIFEDNLGSCERLLTSPVPLFYSRHTFRFLAVWLSMLPFALFRPFALSWNHLAMVPVTSAISLFLLGIEELATQLEEPFTILPMQGFCDKIYNWCTEIVSYKPGANGMKVRAPMAQHMALNLGGAVNRVNGAAANGAANGSNGAIKTGFSVDSDFE